MWHFISDVATALEISQAKVYQLYVYSAQTSTLKTVSIHRYYKNGTAGD